MLPEFFSYLTQKIHLEGFRLTHCGTLGGRFLNPILYGNLTTGFICLLGRADFKISKLTLPTACFIVRFFLGDMIFLHKLACAFGPSHNNSFSSDSIAPPPQLIASCHRPLALLASRPRQAACPFSRWINALPQLSAPPLSTAPPLLMALP